MHSEGFSLVFPLLFSLHTIASIAVATGIVLLIGWALKHLSSEKLKQWGLWLLIGGGAVCLVTLGGAMSMRKNAMKPEMMRMGSMMQMEKMDHDSMDMTMNDMSEMLEGKKGDAFDAAFLEGMIPHHQGAIDMAEAALEDAGHPEIRKMAEDIISAQQREIDQMRSWQKAWGFTK